MVVAISVGQVHEYHLRIIRRHLDSKAVKTSTPVSERYTFTILEVKVAVSIAQDLKPLADVGVDELNALLKVRVVLI